jgi:serine acetyltransferase
LTQSSFKTISANAVVTFDVPDGATVVVQKARIILPEDLSK